MGGMPDWKSDVAEFARQELPAETAERLIGMLRPAIRLSAAEDGEVVVGRLGGVARLPSAMAWPSCADGWPLSFVAELDCGALTRYETDIVLPDTGTLLFFLSTRPEHETQVIYVPSGTVVAERPVPDDRANVHAEQALAAATEPTWPGRDHPALADAFGSIDEAHEAVWDHVVDEEAGESFEMELEDFKAAGASGPPHQVGGYSDCSAFQDSIEAVAARAAGAGLPGDPAFHEEARQWVTLLQVAGAGAAEMTWGDYAYLLWGVRKDHLAARDFSKVHFDARGRWH
ncbi:hypothetical protein GCM10023334_089720 [Nonomuraea thailandensis]